MASTSSQQLFGEDSSDDEDVGSYFVLDRDDDGPPRFGRAFWRTARAPRAWRRLRADDPPRAKNQRRAPGPPRDGAAETLRGSRKCTRGRRCAAAAPRR